MSIRVEIQGEKLKIINSKYCKETHVTQENSIDSIEIEDKKYCNKKYKINEYCLFDNKFRNKISKSDCNLKDEMLTKLQSKLSLLNIKKVLKSKSASNKETNFNFQMVSYKRLEQDKYLTGINISIKSTEAQENDKRDYSINKINKMKEENDYKLEIDILNSAGRWSDSPINDDYYQEKVKKNIPAPELYSNANSHNNYKSNVRKNKKSHWSIFNCFCK
jgi:hypothetical protein